MDACTWQSRLTVLDAALVVVQPGASIVLAARCTLKFPGIDPSCASVAAAVIPAHQPRADHPFFVFVDRIRGVDLAPNELINNFIGLNMQSLEIITKPQK